VTWKVLHTGETNALSVERRLKRDNIEATVPTRTITRIRRGKKVHELRPVLEGYAFARRAVRVKGVKDVLRHADGSHATVTDAEVARISTPQRAAEPDRGLRKGDTVRVLDGPFATFTGTIRETKRAKGRTPARACVHVTVFGRPTPIWCDLEQLEQIEPTRKGRK